MITKSRLTYDPSYTEYVTRMGPVTVGTLTWFVVWGVVFRVGEDMEKCCGVAYLIVFC